MAFYHHLWLWENIINLCSKLISNLKHECLHQKLIQCLIESDDFGSNIITLIMDCYATSSKVAKIHLKVTNYAIKNKLTPIARLKLETSLIHDGIKSFIIFCIPHLLKIFRNTLFGGITHFSSSYISAKFRMCVRGRSVRSQMD